MEFKRMGWVSWVEIRPIHGGDSPCRQTKEDMVKRCLELLSSRGHASAGSRPSECPGVSQSGICIG